VFLLDTDAVSRTSPLSSGGADVRSWLLGHRGHSYISVVTLAELHFGVDRLRRQGASRKAELLNGWLHEIETLFSARMREVDVQVSRRTGELLARAEASGHDPGFADACIAATADLAGYEVVTFNRRHFTALGVPFRVPQRGGP
jgi:predicted nucleic acid-binding protein